MFYIEDKSITKRKKLPIIFLIVGVIFTLVFGFVYFYGIHRKNSMDSEVNAFYIDPNGHFEKDGKYVYHPIYHFRVNNTEYFCKSSASSIKIPTPNSKVFYKENNPNDCITDYTNTNSNYLLIGVVLGIILIIISIISLKKDNKRIRKIKTLLTKGVLIKEVPYKLKDIIINGRNAKRIEVDYEMVNGTTMNLKGKTLFKYKTIESNPYVDLLIDPTDKKNYYIDFNIKHSENVKITRYSPPNQIQNGIPYQANINQNHITMNNNQSNIINDINIINNNYQNNITYNDTLNDSQINNFQVDTSIDKQYNNLIDIQNKNIQNKELIDNTINNFNHNEQIYNNQEEINSIDQSNINTFDVQNNNQNIVQ